MTGELEIYCFIDQMQHYFESKNDIDPDRPRSTLVRPTFTKKSEDKLISDHPNIYGPREEFFRQYQPTRPTYFETGLNFWLFDGYNFNTGMPPSNLQQYGPLIGQLKNKSFTKQIKFRPGFYTGTHLKYAAILVNTTMKSPTLGYTKGLEIRDEWEQFLNTQLKSMPEELQNGFQTTFVWNWLKVKLTLADSAIRGILIGLMVAFPVLIIATMNIFVGFFAFVSLCCVIVCVVAVMPMVGWRLGVLESLNLVLVVGLSVDYIVHLAEAYSRSTYRSRMGRVRNMLTEVGVSVISGAFTTLGASAFMLLAQIVFFNQFAVFIFSTIGFSLLYALAFFTPLMSIWGPQNDFGSIKFVLQHCKARKAKEQRSSLDSGAFNKDDTNIAEV